jgi:hypothetical protein
MTRKRWSRLVVVVLLAFVVGIGSTSLVAGQFNPYAIPAQARPTIIIGDPGGSPGTGGFSVVRDANNVLRFEWKITNTGDTPVTVCPYATLYGVARSPPPCIGQVRGSCITSPPHATVIVKSALNSTQWCYPNILVKTACVNAEVEWQGISYSAYGSDQCITYPGDGFSLYPQGAPPGTPTTASNCCPATSASTSAASTAGPSTPGVAALSLVGVVVAVPLVGATYLRQRKR